ncbi:MAG: cysteine-rich CWC family protein [Niabella sp.]
MTKHEQKYCPRCNASFECKVGDVANCQCSTVKVCEDTWRFLRKTNYDCLCRNCLKEIDQMVRFNKEHPLPKQHELLVEKLHYYWEGGLLVFTELYHLQKGYCCGNGCRHCAYGNAPK